MSALEETADVVAAAGATGVEVRGEAERESWVGIVWGIEGIGGDADEENGRVDCEIGAGTGACKVLPGTSVVDGMQNCIDEALSG